MVKIKTYQDLKQVGESNEQKTQFVFDAITDHRNSSDYKKAIAGREYARGKNVTISNYQKLLYTMSGKAVPDNYTANHKCKSGFFKRFITQETAFTVGNGITFDNENTKRKIDVNLDTRLYNAVKISLAEGVSFSFYNLDHIETYRLTEFVPLYDEMTGALMAGIKFWQIDDNKPLMATLFETDGYTEYQQDDKGQQSIANEKRAYKIGGKVSVADGKRITAYENYPGFPIVPLWANAEHQSELEGIREQIDCYDLIKSGFANDLDDASMIYWTITNAGGMDDVSLAKFIERMKTVKAAVVDGDGDGGTQAEAHTIDVPYQSREVYLARLSKDLNRDAMALDVESIAAGAVTATQIEAAYEPLNEKADELEMCLYEFINGILKIAGVEDTFTFKRSRISNENEQTQMVLSAAEYLDDETILKKLPFISVDEIDDILKRKANEEISRFKAGDEE